MARIRVGTVGYSYRDWVGALYPPGSTPRRQLGHYAQHFDVCELTHFTHQMPDAERMSHFARQIRVDLKFFVRLHRVFTHGADTALSLGIAKHFRKAMERLHETGKLAGLVATFPYAFKNSEETRDYLRQLALALSFSGLPLQADFRHPSWFGPQAVEWLREAGLGLVCIDEPCLPGLVPPLAVSTTNQVLVRLHGRNADAWWSGNATTRHDYSYAASELQELQARYQSLLNQGQEVSFLFQNHWQAQAVRNALQWKALILAPPRFEGGAPVVEGGEGEDDLSRPPMSLSLSEVKSRVSRAFAGLQTALDLPQRK